MANRVLLKKSSVAAKVPLTTDLQYGELALNYADGKLYFKDSANNIKSFTEDSSVVTLAGTQTLSNKTLSSVVLTGSVTAGGSTGTAGQVLASTGTGVQWISVSGTGTVTSITAGSGLSGGTITSSGTISHADTSSVADLSATSRTYVTGLTFDTFGHVTAYTTGTETVTDTNTTYAISAETETGGANLRLTGSDSSTDNVKFSAGSNVSITRTDANTITISSTDTNTTYTAGSGLSLVGTEFSHSDTSSATNLTASSRTYVTGLTFDTFGHVTGYTTGTETVVDTNTTYSAGTGLSLSGTTFNHTNSVTAGTVSEGGATRTLSFGGTFNIPSVTYDAQGHVTSTGNITLTLPSAPADTNTTYGISAETTTGGANLRLTGSDTATDDVKIAGGTNVTVTRTDANTITIASTGGGGGSWSVKTSNYTASTGDQLLANTSGGAFTITLPATPSAGNSVVIADGNNWQTNNLTVARNGSTIKGLSEDLVLDIASVKVDFVYNGSTWLVFAFASGADDTLAVSLAIGDEL